MPPEDNILVGDTAAALAAADAAKAAAAAAAAPLVTPAPGGAKDGPELFEVKVDGNVLKVTRDELLSGYSQASAAQKRMREANELVKQSGEAVKLRDLLMKGRNEDLDQEERLAAIQEAGILLGEDPAEIARATREMLEANTPETPAADTGPYDYNRLPPDVKRAVDKMKADENTARREQIFDVVNKSVDNDPILGRLKGEAAGDPRSIIRNIAKNEVQRRVLALGQAFDSDLLVGILQECRTIASQFGTPKPDPDAEPLEDELSLADRIKFGLSLGEAPVGIKTPSSGPEGSGRQDGERKWPSINDEGAWLTSFMGDVQKRLRTEVAKERRAGT